MFDEADDFGTIGSRIETLHEAFVSHKSADPGQKLHVLSFMAWR
jgi:hypothetical protein